MDITLWVIAALTQIGIATLGIVAIRSELAQRHFAAIAITFCVLSLLNLVATGVIAIRASKYSDMVAQLTQRILYEITGSPDNVVVLHPYFLGDSENGIPHFNIYNESDYPSIDTHISIDGTMNIEDKGILAYREQIGILHPHGGGRLTRPPKIHFNKEKDNRIDFCISTRSATYWQHIYATWTGESWAIDWSLRKSTDGKKEVYVKRLRDDFPFLDKANRIEEIRNEEYDARIAREPKN